jgi:tetratricopeptide (TPR) repeat protein
LTGVHLLEQHVPGRYTFHDLLRAYAAEQAEHVDPSSHRRAAVRRVLDHYLHTAYAGCMLINPHRETIPLDPPDPAVAPEPLADDLAAYSWFTAERPVLVAAVTRAAGEGFAGHSWRLAWALVSYLSRAGHWGDQVATQRVAVTAASEAGDRLGQAQAHRLLGNAYLRSERYDESELHMKLSLEVFEDLDDRVGAATVHADLGWLFEYLGRYDEALVHDLRAMELGRETGRAAIHANALNAVGWTYALLGRHEEAIEHCRQALSVLEEIGEVEGQACAWDSIAFSHHHLGQQAEAVACFRTSVRLFKEVGNRYLVGTTLGRLVDPLWADGQYDEARAVGDEAVTVLRQLGHSDAESVRAKLDRLESQART